MKLNLIQKQFIINNYPEKGGPFCAESLNIPREAVSWFAGGLGLKTYAPRRRKNNIDIEKWKKMEDKYICYFLGLLFADGSIDKKRVYLGISSTDFNDIKENLKKTYNKACTYTKKRVEGWKEISCLYLLSMDLCDFIREFNFKGNDFSCINHIPKNNIKYFLRGLIDGDGHLKYRTCDRGGSVLFNIASCHNFDWTILNKFFTEIFNYTPRIVRNTHKKTGHQNSVFYITSSAVLTSFFNWIYEDYEEDKLGFSRKYEQYLKIKKHFELIIAEGRNTSKHKNFLTIVELKEKVDKIIL
jgi:hypothetical protein